MQGSGVQSGDAKTEGNAMAHAVQDITMSTRKTRSSLLGATLVTIRAGLSGLTPEGRSAFLGDLRQFIDRIEREERARVGDHGHIGCYLSLANAA
jgi:hypothetical protein